MADIEQSVPYFLPSSGEDATTTNERAAMGEYIRDHLYDQVDTYQEVMWVLVAGLFAWAHDVEHAGSHERDWPHHISRLQAMRIAAKHIEKLMAEEERREQVT